MMMSKPAPEKKAEEDIPAFATPPVVKKTPQSAVEDLERRLAMLGGSSTPPDVIATYEEEKSATLPALSASAATAAAAAPVVKGGKNALLARIMAAKERTQQAQTKTEPPKEEPIDLLSGFDAPASANDPPPAYETNFLQPPPVSTVADLPPPAFESVEEQMLFPPPPPIDSIMPPPPIESVTPSAPMASAPFFEDLLETNHHPQSSLMDVQAVPPPPASTGIDDDILAALDPAERAALLEEQQKIMEQIEREKANNEASSAAARAMAFDQRSSAAVAQVAGTYDRPGRRTAPAARAAAAKVSQTSGPTVDLGAGEKVPLHGQERTQQAIKEGNAIIVQCVNCHNWMQVTKDATLMFCPTCQVVSPVDSAGAASADDMEAAAQLAADAQLAEKLQNEEYQRASGSETVREKPRKQKIEKGEQVEQSWYDWFMGTTPTKPAAAVPERGSAEIRRSPALVSAQTGEEGVGRSRSYDESEGLINRTPSGGARVAQSKSMFACVADSVSTAAASMTGYALTTDEEGNVHGVDSTSLLAMPEVSRQREE